ncbi:MAG TPA: peptidylprolyl isomerase [Candidatus Cloacimonadota bacterium]|nr:peptidylprolyl isomerase [Candidatus Cloacimonadota bacterium]HPT72770.1 peptidylprolyl isomerase [Candidatus Cloacimonadota bacterium]
MKSSWILIILAAMLSSGFLYAEVLDRIVAKVGNEVILNSDLQKQMSQMKNANMLTEGETERDVLNEMVESRLVIQKAKDLDYKVDEDRVKNLVEKQMKTIQANFKTEEAFYSELRKSHLTKSELSKYFTDLYTEQMLKEQIIDNQIKRKVKVSDVEVSDYFREHKAELPMRPVMYQIGMIMRQVHVSDQTKAQKKAEITSILAKLKKGANFAELAKKESEDPGSAENGGDLGFFSRGMMVKPFEDAAYNLKVGDISDIVETQFGYHIIKLEEKNGDEIRVRHILKLLVPDRTDSLATKELMNNVLTKLRGGASFMEMAQKYSEDDSSAVNGGIIGEFNDDTYPVLFKSYLTDLPVGQYTEVVENEGLYYIFGKLAEVPSREFKFNEVKPQLTEYVTSQKQLKLYQQWIDQLKKENYVEILL